MFCLLIVRNVQFKMLKRLKTYVQCRHLLLSLLSLIFGLKKKLYSVFLSARSLLKMLGSLILVVGLVMFGVHPALRTGELLSSFYFVHTRKCVCEDRVAERGIV
jgi:hypothetical protein